MNEIDILLENIYNESDSNIRRNSIAGDNFPQLLKEWIDVVIDNSEKAKGVLTVVITGLAYKLLHPEQDVRKHQSSIPQGYSARTFDTKHITPFLKAHQFPAMAESGWLTRSLEQKVPYDSNYPGAISPESLKSAFLGIYDITQNEPNLCKDILTSILQKLIEKRDAQIVAIARPHNLSINEIINLLSDHFNGQYSSRGASRLPVLAIYAAYQALMTQIFRYKGKKLLPLACHTSSDTQSGRLGDIDIVDENGDPYESVEIKHGIPISHAIVSTAKEKIHPTPVLRYYILSTAPIKENDKAIIDTDIKQIKNTHGCQLVTNGVLPTLKYYLRLFEDTSKFIDNYANLIAIDGDIKFEHRNRWNQLVANL